jgi:hypothetical protein
MIVSVRKYVHFDFSEKILKCSVWAPAGFFAAMYHILCSDSWGQPGLDCWDSDRTVHGSSDSTKLLSSAPDAAKASDILLKMVG